MELKELRRIFEEMDKADQQVLRELVYETKIPFDKEISEMLERDEISWATAKKIHSIGMSSNPLWRIVLDI